MNSVNYIATLIISTLGLGGIVIYLGKRIIDKSLDIGVEKYKSTLNRDLESHKAELLRQTEEFRANLQMISLEHQVRYTKLHDERGQSIKKIYSLLVELQNRLQYFTSVFQGPEWVTDVDKENAAREALNELSNFFQINRIYYPEPICTTIDEILKVSWEVIIDMSVAKDNSANAGSGPERALALREWRNNNVRVSTEIDSTRKKLQREFKKILGVE